MDSEARRPRPVAILAVLVIAGALLCAGFAALGAWQVKRLGWKHELIERVERHLAAAPVPAPPPAQWPSLGRDDEYRRVEVQGTPDYEHEVLVRAATELGGGYWVLTPLRTGAGHWVFVNRGFVPPELRGRVPRAGGALAVAGLLRPSEPGGSLLQANQPAEGRWYSRDVAAMAAAGGLPGPVAPFFIDAQTVRGGANAPHGPWPRPGLTVVKFNDNHLVYAVTWFVLAGIVAGAVGYLLVDERRLRRKDGPLADRIA